MSTPNQHCFLSRVLLCGMFFLSMVLHPGVMHGKKSPSVSPDQLMAEGTTFYQKGNFEKAASSWDTAAGMYESTNQPAKQTQALLQLAYALQSLGFHEKTKIALEFALNLAKRHGSSQLTAVILGRLGTVYLALNQPHMAQQILRQALAVARRNHHQPLLGSLLNDWGNALAVEDHFSEALGAYTESMLLAESTGSPLLFVHGLSNSALVFIKMGQYEESRERLNQAWDVLQSVPSSHDSVYAMLSIGLAFSQLRPRLPQDDESLLSRAGQVFRSAVLAARDLGDARAESYAWGYLGRLYEEEQRFQESLELTRRAILAGQRVNTPESLYRWEWQTGRLFRALGRYQEAIQAYRRAMATLQPIRNELSLGTLGGPAPFRESMGPLFFELSDLLLQESDAADDADRQSEYLYQVRDTIEAFKTAELQDYFRDDCVQAVQTRMARLEGVSPTTAIIYPIMFPTRVELLVSMGEIIKRISIPVSSETMVKEIHTFRSLLEKRTTHEYLPHAQTLYNILIRPLVPLFQEFHIETLVFVPDGALRTIPMSALHDGEHFLIQDYAMATTPGLTLTDPQPINRTEMRILSVGLTKSVQGFPPLPNVANEVKTIQTLYGGQVLLDERFKVREMEKAMRQNPYSIVHIASHGKFESQAQNSFLLAFDEKLTMDRLDQLIGLFQFRDTPLDLLTLSACETAAGDDRAALGLAGIAIKAGARSALATLWFINDRASSDLVEEFYQQLSDPSMSKAQALRHAQLQLLAHRSYRHPGYWAPFLLINNWL